MDFEQRLRRLRELLEQKDKIEQELRALIIADENKPVLTGGKVEISVASREQEDIIGRERGRSPRRRSEQKDPTAPKTMRGMPKPCCGSKGQSHLATCEFAAPYQKREKCAECGSTGARHFSTCPKAGQGRKGRQDMPESRQTLTEAQYAAVRSAIHGRDFSSAQYALTNKLSPREVNKAVRAPNYGAYLDESE